MNKNPDKITKADNLKSSTYPNAKQGLYLFNFLKSLDAFELGKANADIDIAEFMYEFAPSTDRGNRDTTKDPSHYKSISYGQNRIKHLKRKDQRYAFTHLEAVFLHRIFTNVTSKEWGSEITPEALVTENIYSIINRLASEGVPLPDSINCSIILKALDAKYDPAMTISPRDWPTKLGGMREAPRENLEYDHEIPVLRKGYEYLLEVRNLENPATNNLFIFESSNHPMKLIGGNERLELFAYRLFEPAKKTVEITDIDPNTKIELPYYISQYAGEFTFYALAYPRRWDFEKVFGINLNLKDWNSETSRNFLRRLQHQFQKHPNELQLASYTYRVN